MVVAYQAEDEHTLSHIPYMEGLTDEEETSFCSRLKAVYEDGIHGTREGWCNRCFLADDDDYVDVYVEAAIPPPPPTLDPEGVWYSPPLPIGPAETESVLLTPTPTLSKSKILRFAQYFSLFFALSLA